MLVGVGAGIALLFGAAFAREVGGVRTLGLFGAGITLGVAAPLALGSILEDAGVDWRVGFGVSAAVALTALPLIPREVPRPPAPQEPRQGLLREALTSASSRWRGWSPSRRWSASGRARLRRPPRPINPPSARPG